MQTLANMSSSREVMRQVEINHSAMARLDAFYSSYRRALHHQLNSKTPELLDVLRHAAAIGATPRASMGGDPRLPGTPAAAGAAAAAAAANASSSGTPPLHQQQQQQQKSDASPATPVAGSGGGGGPGGLKRKKSIWIHASVNAGAGGAGADSLFAVDETALAFTVETLKSKVLSSNDRYVTSILTFSSYLGVVLSMYSYICCALRLAFLHQPPPPPPLLRELTLYLNVCHPQDAGPSERG